MCKTKNQPSIEIFLGILNEYVESNRPEHDFLKHKMGLMILPDMIEWFINRPLNVKNLLEFDLNKRFLDLDLEFYEIKKKIFFEWIRGEFPIKLRKVSKILKYNKQIKEKILDFRIQRNVVNTDEDIEYWDLRISKLSKMISAATPYYQEFLSEFIEFKAKDIKKIKKALAL